MNAIKAKLLQILSSVSQFIIPIDQRTYSWPQKECQQLWNDTLRAGSSEEIGVHLIGSMVPIDAQLARKSSTSTPACLRMARSVPSGMSPA